MLEPRTMNYMEIVERIRDVVRQNMETKLKESDEIEWDKDFETLLFYAMRGLKPVGVNRHFMMAVIHDRFSSYVSKELSSKLIWDHLETLYDMAALHESEIMPFPNEETEFELPEEVDEMVKEKFGVVLPRPPKDENEAPKSNSSIKSVKKLGTPKLKQSTNATPNAKNTFQTPVSVKTSKNHTGSKSESRPPSAERIVKGKQESQLPARANKANRASSPFTTKNAKPETISSTPEASNTTPVSASKKSSKNESHSSSSKKTPKSEPTSSSNTLKKSAKGESNSSSSKHAKSETPDNSNKKVKPEKEHSSKKSKVSLPAENSSKKSSKSDMKKAEAESNHKKSSDTSTSKSKGEKEKGHSKGSKSDDLESSHHSGSRKSSAGKADIVDKKKTRQRVEESLKKGTPPAKRRRTGNS